MMEQESEASLMHDHSTDEGQKITYLSSGFTFLNADYSLVMKQEPEASLMYHHSTDEGERSTYLSSDNGTMNTESKDNFFARCSENNPLFKGQSESGNVNALQISEMGIHSSRQMSSESINEFGREEGTHCEGFTFLNTHCSLMMEQDSEASLMYHHSTDEGEKSTYLSSGDGTVNMEIKDSFFARCTKKNPLFKAQSESGKVNAVQISELGIDSSRQMSSESINEFGREEGTQCEGGISISTDSNLYQGIPKVDIHDNTYTECESNLSYVNLLAYQQNTKLISTQNACMEYKKPFCEKLGHTGHPGGKHVAVKPYQCTECDVSFSMKRNLIVHLRTHLAERRFRCAYCEKNFCTKRYLEVHLRTHSGPFQCTECKKGFIQEVDLNRHQRIHLGDKPYNCTKCSKSFIRNGHFLRHQKMHIETEEIHIIPKIIHHRTSKEESLYPCTECEKTFRLKQSLIVHIRGHLGETVFECTECKKSFTTKKYLKIHMRMHSGDLPFECSECKKGFIHRGNFRRHQRIHLRARPYYNCTKCWKVFTRRENLIRHQMIHADTSTIASIERHQSAEHDKNISTQSDFNKQHKTHSGERQVQCTACEKSFRPISDHIRPHRTCPECENSIVQNTHNIIQQIKHRGEGTRKTHIIMARLLEVSIPNDYFILRHKEVKDAQIIEDPTKGK